MKVLNKTVKEIKVDLIAHLLFPELCGSDYRCQVVFNSAVDPSLLTWLLVQKSVNRYCFEPIQCQRLQILFLDWNTGAQFFVCNWCCQLNQLELNIVIDAYC